VRDRPRGTAAALVAAVRTLAILAISVAACAGAAPPSEDNGATSGASIGVSTDLSGCHGKASSVIAPDGRYVMTTFGGGADTQRMSCGGIADGTGWYAASRQRYGCGAKLQVEANGNCVVVAAEDYGPDVCVEAAAHMPVMDLSPRASEALYGVSGAGWSDHLVVTVTAVDASTPLGACASGGGGGGGGSGSGSGGGGGGGGGGGASCSSSTLARSVDDGTCVQSAGDAAWYQCANGSWTAIADSSGCATAYAWCHSATLGRDVPPRTCVQSAASSTWFQCNGQSWVTPVDTGAQSGPIGACSSWNPL
jgi:uncharacterized membrane protein YgcG